MLITDIFDGFDEDYIYIDGSKDLFCEYEDRQIVNCTEEFLNLGFLSSGRWDMGAEYNYKCKTCPYFRHDAGYYFGKGQYSNNFEQKEKFDIDVKTTEELAEVVKHMPNAKALLLGNGRDTDLSPIENLKGLEYARLDLGSKNVLWDMSKTPNLKILQICFGISPPLLDMLSKASSVEYLYFYHNTSQINPTVLPSFDFFDGMKSLKHLVLSGITNLSRKIDALIELPRLEKLWVSPNLFPMEDYAKFEAKKFKIFSEYGIFENNGDYVHPLGIGTREFKTEKAKAKFLVEYHLLMDRYR
ncbi:MAG: hypothetical protein ACI4MS_02625 [Candidatus Coproplasma sp.]